MDRGWKTHQRKLASSKKVRTKSGGGENNQNEIIVNDDYKINFWSKPTGISDIAHVAIKFFDII